MFEKKKQAELIDSIELMLSDDYKDRFKAEYMQLKIRHAKLSNSLRDYVVGRGHIKFSRDYGLLLKQAKLMDELLMILRVRAQIEGIDLNGL